MHAISLICAKLELHKLLMRNLFYALANSLSKIIQLVANLQFNSKRKLHF